MGASVVIAKAPPPANNWRRVTPDLRELVTGTSVRMEAACGLGTPRCVWLSKPVA